jgi:hypothetical protein
LASILSQTSRPILILTIITVAFTALLALPIPLAAGEQAPTIAGRLLDPQGEPVSGAHVTVFDDEESIGEAESNLDGLFMVDLERLPQHSVRVHVQRAHFYDGEWNSSSDELQILQNDHHLLVPDLSMERHVTIGFWVATLTFAGLLVLIATERLHNTLVALLGMAVIFLVSYIGAPISPDMFILDFEQALHYINFEVFFLVMGMMVVIGLVEETGIF